MSGTHGPEGFAGSAIQSAEFAYRNFPGKEEYSQVARPTQIYVHAVNPFGMHNNRRVNEDNIDLNRNFLMPQEFAKAKARDPNHAGYVTFDHLLNPSSKPFDSAVLNKLHATWLMVYSIARHGLLSIKRAMVSGNYHKPDGLYYGGDHMAASTSKLIEFLTSYFAAHNGPPRGSDMVLSDDADSHAVVPLKKVVFIDVHSGLGVSGLDTLDVDPRSAGLAYRYV